MDKKQLEEFVKSGLSQRKIADKVGKSQTSIRYWCLKHGLKTKSKASVYRATCICCHKDIVDAKHPNRIYCSNKCQGVFRWNKIKKEIEKKGMVQNSKQGRNYFLEVYGNKCTICNNVAWNNKPIPLVLDHKDGNSSNWLVSNLRLVCPNCDALLPTYKGRNRGNGRHARKQRYAEGKSY